MAKADKQAVQAFLNANPNTSEGELIAALLEEKRARQKAAANATLPNLAPKVKAADKAPLKAWLLDGATDGNVKAETEALAALLVADDMDGVSISAWTVAKACLKAFENMIPQLPPTPQV